MNDVLTIPAQMKLIPLEIWSPKYSTDSVLIAAKKVKLHNHYRVYFTQAKHLKGQEFYISAKTIKLYPKITNGVIPCYEVPMSELKPFKRERNWT